MITYFLELKVVSARPIDTERLVHEAGARLWSFDHVRTAEAKIVRTREDSRDIWERQVAPPAIDLYDLSHVDGWKPGRDV